MSEKTNFWSEIMLQGLLVEAYQWRPPVVASSSVCPGPDNAVWSLDPVSVPPSNLDITPWNPHGSPCGL